jgi:hypothetical protein
MDRYNQIHGDMPLIGMGRIVHFTDGKSLELCHCWECADSNVDEYDLDRGRYSHKRCNACDRKLVEVQG